ncbi:MAG: iron-containing alcohol dehydrogenase, partial [Actinobacteria bacterium]|nr:iron-containing alcohol dehydrogenase [Actinomycetota bacterium]MBT7470667.1 iron-containing alcohol dehydrogenase [Actinomycetota bacterium]
MPDLNATWGFPTQIRIGAGRISELPQACVAAGMTRPLIVTDPGIAQLPLLGVVQAALAADGITAGVF